jgi:CO/xanthine dehydrogenase FAD-binding subunit
VISRIPVTSARDLAQAYALLGQRPQGLRVLAGGTDLMAALNARVGVERIGHVLDIWRVPELRGIDASGGVLRVGALTTYAELMRSSLVRESLPALCAVSREVGAVAIQNRGTLGGNVCTASPAGDTLPLLLAAEARLVLGGPRGERIVPIEEFFVAYRKTALGADELLLRIDVPLLPGARLSYRKVGTRKAQSVSRVLVAVRKGGGPLRIAAGCVGPLPLRCKETEAEAEKGHDLRAALRKDIAPIDDLRATAVYRSRVTANVLERLLE